ncbi:MAG: DNA replication complex GINS family protein [Thermoproteota archaeon]|nr:DNA replication complex GINS family protein [Thermoproteota archaeon]
MPSNTSSDNEVKIIQGAYRIEYLMEEVRVSYKRDVNVSVGGLTIDAKEGDLSSLPRWVAKILLDQDTVEIPNNHVSTYISRALNRERIAKPHDLSGIDTDFYIRVNDYLEGLKERERENLIVSMNSFIASRLEKIVKLAAASPLSPELKEKLSAEENELYILVHNSSSTFKQRVLKKFV